KLLECDAIKCEVVEIDENEMQLRAIVENLKRQGMNPIEEARAYQALIDQGYTVAQIIEELSLKSTAIVTQRLALLNLTPEIQKLVATGNLLVAMAWGVSLVSPARQGEIVRHIASGKLRTVEQVR